MAGDEHGLAGHCYDQMPGEPYHCLITEPPHDGDHYHWPSKTSWPQTADDPSKPIAGGPARRSTD